MINLWDKLSKEEKWKEWWRSELLLRESKLFKFKEKRPFTIEERLIAEIPSFDDLCRFTDYSKIQCKIYNKDSKWICEFLFRIEDILNPVLIRKIDNVATIALVLAILDYLKTIDVVEKNKGL
jgi:hypothetical protein